MSQSARILSVHTSLMYCASHSPDCIMADVEGGLEGDLLGDGEGLYDDTFVENSEEQPKGDDAQVFCDKCSSRALFWTNVA